MKNKDNHSGELTRDKLRNHYKGEFTTMSDEELDECIKTVKDLAEIIVQIYLRSEEENAENDFQRSTAPKTPEKH